MNWLDLVKFFAPIILAKINPHLAQASDAMVKGIFEAQAMKESNLSITNEQQLNHAVNITNDAVAAINASTGKERIDSVLVSNLAGDAISAIVNVTKHLHNSPVNINK